MKPSYGGPQHDETQNLAFRLAGKSDRELVGDASLHPTVRPRFDLSEVLQYDTIARYRPGRRSHVKLAASYADVPFRGLPAGKPSEPGEGTSGPATANTTGSRQEHENLRKVDGVESGPDYLVFRAPFTCLGSRNVCSHRQLAESGFVGQWRLARRAADGCRNIVELANWIGLQILFDWVFRLPLSVACLIAGIALFWLLGTVISAMLYQRQVRTQKLTTMPSQSHA